MKTIIKQKEPSITLEEIKSRGFNPKSPNQLAKALYIEEYLHTDANTTITFMMLTYDVVQSDISIALDLLIRYKEKYIKGVQLWEESHNYLDVVDYIINGEPKI